MSEATGGKIALVSIPPSHQKGLTAALFRKGHLLNLPDCPVRIVEEGEEGYLHLSNLLHQDQEKGEKDA